jgi:hypothetical protein
MVLPIVFAAGGSLVSHLVTKDAEERKAERKVELIAKLAELTPQQASAVEAVKKAPVEELEDRVTLGIGPFAPLPEQASERAKEMRAQMQTRKEAALKTLTPEQRGQLAKSVAELTPEEEAELDAAPNKEQTAKEIAERKVQQVLDVMPEVQHLAPAGPQARQVYLQ